METERLKGKTPKFDDIKGVVIPLYYRKQRSRNFMFIIMASSKSALLLQEHSMNQWNDGRCIEIADNSLIVYSKSLEQDIQELRVGKYKKLHMSVELDKLNFISTQLFKLD
ncbi:hypothetical protein PVAND_005135 [Polypedilum vanderplanki]|uniref:Uncharacterized protein n=1 Tax=Polypedilum vanderplanki TaxID=319348 RepID=A0A9J6C075_POLVA|nr:hypothetical protein PVAND_005135 [Polypedilum vanderplanki]